MVIQYEDLSPLARTYLGVVGAGLVPARLANDDAFRLDYLTAVCAALQAGLPPSANLEGDGPQPSSDFIGELRAVVADLDTRGIIMAGAGDGMTATMSFLDPAASQLTPAQIAALDLNQPPKVLDRYLSHRALDDLLSLPAAYTFIMEKYGASSEIWQRLAAQGYGR